MITGLLNVPGLDSVNTDVFCKEGIPVALPDSIILELDHGMDGEGLRMVLQVTF